MNNVLWELSIGAWCGKPHDAHAAHAYYSMITSFQEIFGSFSDSLSHFSIAYGFVFNPQRNIFSRYLCLSGKGANLISSSVHAVLPHKMARAD